MKIKGWTVWTSDAGRMWATRLKPLTAEEFDAGCSRTIDADTPDQLAEVIAHEDRRVPQARQATPEQDPATAWDLW